MDENRPCSIPPRILEAPPEYLDPSMVEAFRQVGFGALPVWTSQGCALFVHIDARTIRACRYAVHSVRLELHEVDGCPLIRLYIVIYDNPKNPLRMDCFLNLQEEHQGYAARALAEQEVMVFHWYDEQLKYQRSSVISWGPEQQVLAAHILAAAEEIIKRTGGGDFDRAKARFMAENPL